MDRVRLVAVLGVVWLALYAALTAVSRSRGAMLAVDVAYLVPILAATALSVAAARAARGRTRRAWTLLATSNASWAAGELIWVAYAHLGSGPPGVSVADIFYLSSYVIALPAILIGFGAANPLRHVRGLLDAAPWRWRWARSAGMWCCARHCHRRPASRRSWRSCTRCSVWRS